MHVRANDVQRTGGTYCGARAAVRADLVPALDFLGSILNLNALGPEILDTVFEVFLGAAQLEHHDAFSARQDGGIVNVENQIVIFGQIADNRLLRYGCRKFQNQYFFVLPISLDNISLVTSPSQVCFLPL